jgi:hypothetical protein
MRNAIRSELGLARTAIDKALKLSICRGTENFNTEIPGATAISEGASGLFPSTTT